MENDLLGIKTTGTILCLIATLLVTRLATRSSWLALAYVHPAEVWVYEPTLIVRTDLPRTTCTHYHRATARHKLCNWMPGLPLLVDRVPQPQSHDVTLPCTCTVGGLTISDRVHNVVTTTCGGPIRVSSQIYLPGCECERGLDRTPSA